MYQGFKMLIALLVVMLCSFSVKLQTRKTIKVVYFIDGIEQNINNSSRLLLISKLDTIEGKLDSSKLLSLPPRFNGKEYYDVVFLYKKDTLIFKNINYSMLIPDQNFEWRFGIDNRPFDKFLGIIPYDEYLKDTITSKLTYWLFDPLEKGDGVMFYNKIR